VKRLSRRLDRVAKKIDPPPSKGTALVRLLESSNATDIDTPEGYGRRAKAVSNWQRAFGLPIEGNA